jgi:hypothetical protein
MRIDTSYRAASMSALSAADRLAEFAEIIAMFREMRRDLALMTELAADPKYGAMMAMLRRAAVQLELNPGAAEPKALLELASKQLAVPVVDLMALPRVPAHFVETGAWRPRSVNVDLVEPDESSKMETTAFQESLNKLSDRILPGVKQFRPPGLYSLYMAAGAALPVVDAYGKAFEKTLGELASIVREWSDDLADDVQLHLREIRQATSASGLNLKDLKELHPIEQRMALMTGQALSGLALEAETFIRWARDPESIERPTGITAKLKRWASAGIHGLANFLRAAASGARAVTDRESWTTAAVHVQLGGGLEKWWVSSRAGATLMFPTLEQVKRDGEAVVKVVSRLNPVDTILGGMTLSSRGGGVSFRAGPIGAKVSDFEHEVKAGIPGIIGLAVGEDYAYGPVLAFGYSPPVGLLNVLPLPVNVRVGGEVKLFHPMFAGLSRPTRSMAEGISIGCDAIHRTVTRAHEIDDGWPLQQRWNLVRRLVERALVSRAVAEERIAKLKEIEPAGLMEHIGEARARTLGRDAERPVETHQTIASYLDHLLQKIDDETNAIAELARAASRDEAVDGARLKALSASLKRSIIAFEFVDILLYRLLVEPELERAREVGGEHHEAHGMYGEERHRSDGGARPPGERRTSATL